MSTRRRQIEAHLEEHGQHGSRAAQVATYATRTAKDVTLDAEGLLPSWRRRAASLGFDGFSLAGVLDRATVVEPPAPESLEAERLYRWLASPEGLTRQASTFGERDVIKAVCNALPNGGRIDAVLDLVDGFLCSEHVLAITADRDGAAIRRHDGKVIAARTAEQQWTTHEMLETEQAVVDSALFRRLTNCGVANRPAVQAAVTARGTLSPEQDQMVRTLCSSGDGIEVVEGVAGAGKTFALAAAREAREASGYRVIGCSLAARAAKHLQDDAGIHASTIDRLLTALDRSWFAPRTVVVVDEAAMVGTRKLARLLDHAERADAKVVLVGDPCQLPEIEAGGAFRGLRSRLGASVLAENRRQVASWERESLGELRHGDVDQALDSYVAHGRVHQAASDGDAREMLVEEWMNARAEGDDALMVASRLSDVDDLNGRARRILQEEGYLGPDQIRIGQRAFADGDQVLALRNDYRLGLLNGTRATIDRIDIERRHLVVTIDGNERREIPFEYLASGHLTHGYATTIHKAQGATVDRCLVLADDSAAREHAYTALSRGRHGNDIFVVADDHRMEDRHTAEVERDPLDGLRAAIRHSASKGLAIDSIEPRNPSTLERLRAERHDLAERLGPAPPAMSIEIRRLIEERRRAEHSREDAERRFHTAQHDLDDLGPIGRRSHRTKRRDIDQRITDAGAEIARLQMKITTIDERITEHAPAIRERATWEHDHGTEIDRLDQLDRQIQMAQRLDSVASRGLERSLERDHGLELGL